MPETELIFDSPRDNDRPEDSDFVWKLYRDGEIMAPQICLSCLEKFWDES